MRVTAWAAVGAVVALFAAIAPSTAAAQLSAEIDPNPDDASAQVFGPVTRVYTVRNTGPAFSGRLQGSNLGHTRRARPTISHLAQLQFPVTVPAGMTSVFAETGNASSADADLDLFLFDCTTGTCVQRDAGIERGTATERVERANPAPGLWIVLIDAFAVPSGTTQFDYADTFAGPSFGTLATVDANAPRPAGSTWSVTATLTPLVAAPAGRQLTGEVAVVDAMGAPIARAPVSFRVDTTPPDTTITGPSGPVNTRTPTFELASTEARSTFVCVLDTQTLPTCSSPLTTAPLQDGPHELEVAAIDPAGNVDPSPESHTFTVDVTAPLTTITSGPNAIGRDRTPTVAFTVDDAGATVACRVDGSAFAACASPFTSAELEDGEQHSIEVRATDAAGNVGPATTSFVVTAPTALVAHATQLVAGSDSPAATLTHWRTAAPVAGRTVVFTAAGRQICSATTDAAGVATCSGPATGTEYFAGFEGDPQFAPAGARGVLTAAQAGCTSPDRLRLRVRRGTGTGLRVRASLEGARIVKAELRRAGRRVRTLSKQGMRVSVDLTGLEAGGYAVRVTIRLKGGKRVTASRRVTAC